MTYTSPCVGRSRFNEVRAIHTQIRDACETEQMPSTRRVGFLVNLVSRIVHAYMPNQPNRGRTRVRLSHARRLRKDSHACVCCAEPPRADGAATAVLTLFALAGSHANPIMFVRRLLMTTDTASAPSGQTV